MNALQSKILDIFLEVKKICEKHNLRYFAIGGTCLGAVRHKGFIPWDDDLDIAMPDADFEKFLEIAPKELPAPLELLKLGELKHSVSFFAKVHDTQTTFLEKVELAHPDSYKGVFVDIMPFYGLPSNERKRKKLLRKLKYLRKMNSHHRLSFSYAPNLPSRALWIVTRAVSWWAPDDYYYRKWQKAAGKNKFDESEYTGFLWSRSQRLLEKSWFDDAVELPFETTSIRCPKDFHGYLTKHFGDYMQLPPEEERVPLHGGGVIDLEKSYHYYQEHGVAKI